METMTANRLSTHGPAVVGQKKKYRTHKCSYKGCKKAFTSEQALAMHVGRKHTHTICNASSKAIAAGVAKRRAKRHAKFNGVSVVEAPKSECSITGPGLRIEFTPALLPTLLHTIALSLGKHARV